MINIFYLITNVIALIVHNCTYASTFHIDSKMYKIFLKIPEISDFVVAFLKIIFVPSLRKLEISA